MTTSAGKNWIYNCPWTYICEYIVNLCTKRFWEWVICHLNGSIQIENGQVFESNTFMDECYENHQPIQKEKDEKKPQPKRTTR